VNGFDDLAASYDRAFSRTSIGALMRRAVWRRLDVHFQAGHRVLDLNCGTGEDAVFLGRRGVQVLATDASPEMVRVATTKVADAQLSGMVRVERLAIEQLSSTGPLLASPFDGALSNFGGINCIADLEGAAAALAGCVRPGGVALLCVMGPLVPWEWIWFLLQGQPRRAFRRLQRDGAEWRGMRIQYPSIGRLRRAFAPYFRVLRVSGLGAVLPPPYTGRLWSRWPVLLEILDRVERTIEAVPPVPWLADHYVIELRR
jgi:SAM-dependent methyltransferase